VPQGERARVVERFVRLENSRNQPGSGLGLSLVAAVAEAHGGRLELDEGPGKVGGVGPGLRVALVLPRAD
jgi:signal transduction histidine kinase